VQTSIVVVTFNNRAEVDACLRSLQAYSTDAEIIVVDNLSTDGTLDHVQQHYPRVRAVSAGCNGGFGAGVNLGAKMASGTFLAVVNPDAEVEPGWLQPLLEVLEEQPRVGMVTPTILLRGTEDCVNACGNDVHLTGLAFCRDLNKAAPSRCAAARPVGAISGAAFVLRRSLWEELGGFDERFFMYLEDTDLSWRARRLGYTILHVPASRIRHDYQLSVAATKLYHLEHNRLLMLRKNLSSRTLLALSPALALTEALTWAFCARSGPAYLRAKWHAYRRFWRMRGTIQPCSVAPPSRRADGALLRSLSSRLTLEQLATGRAPATASHALAVFYAAWRWIALVAVRW
jgi:GT2 family glycosyltransferase